MEYYEAICILEENENLNFLNLYNIKINSKYISQLKKEIALLIVQKKGMPFEHFPEWSLEKKVDYHHWRKKNNYPKINDFFSNTYGEFSTIESNQLKKTDANSLLKFFSQKILKINTNLLLNIDFKYCTNDEFKCVELPYSKKSIVLLGRRKEYFSVEETIYFFHEVGHAIYNSFKYCNKFYVPIELDEVFAHLFEFYFYYTYFYSKIDMDNDLLLYKKILNKKLTNNIIYADFVCKICQTRYNEEEKQNLLNTIALKNGIAFDLTRKTSWKDIPEIFNYPFYSASYIFIEYFIASFISNNIKVDFSKFENNIASTLYNLSKNWEHINWTEELSKLFLM
ncbi:TPA: hypothetical protein QFC14_002416 [Enterococcus faecium]|uniref:hypothetical protein n=1 Tax=Enterococcus faecium TaxID=1352 RepID=UPI002DD6F075|nr:hypothetical protein [Enterococcus faecium]EME8145374.1 hypothetical protein [Enterococcus faecium]